MNKVYSRLCLVLLAFVMPLSIFAQSGFGKSIFPNYVQTLTFGQPDLSAINAKNLEAEKNGQLYRIGFSNEVSVNLLNSGTWSTNIDGDKVWRLVVKYPGAKALSFFFSKFELYGTSSLNVYNSKGQRVHETLTADDMLDHGQQNMSLCLGDYLMLELVEDQTNLPAVLEMDDIVYIYRGENVFEDQQKDYGDSESCQVNANCSPEGDDWKDQMKGVGRVLVRDGSGQGWCSGSLVNNTNQDCKPYFLLAMHCGQLSTASHFNSYRFYFRYESTGCSNPSTSSGLATGYITGCFKIAGSEDVSGSNTIAKSDFLLVQIGTASTEVTTKLKLRNKGVYYNGWDVSGSVTAGGVGIHHPSGDIKKISKFNSTPANASYSGINSGTHWRVNWVATSNGHGVTEGGSSGSPLFLSSTKRIIGVLSGGSSYCSSPNSPDLYGKLSYSWTSAGTTDDTRLKPWLDPTNSGVTYLDGVENPCNMLSIDEMSKKMESQIMLSPNPTRDIVSVEFENALKSVTIQIVDLTGKTLLSVKSNASFKVDLNVHDLAQGVYHVIINTEAGTITKKMNKI